MSKTGVQLKQCTTPPPPLKGKISVADCIPCISSLLGVPCIQVVIKKIAIFDEYLVHHCWKQRAIYINTWTIRVACVWNGLPWGLPSLDLHFQKALHSKIRQNTSYMTPWPTNWVNWVTTFRTDRWQVVHAVNVSTTCVGVAIDTSPTQLNSTGRRVESVELCRYKRPLTDGQTDR